MTRFTNASALNQAIIWIQTIGTCHHKPHDTDVVVTDANGISSDRRRSTTTA